jgi:hypothetical protein
VGTAALDPRRLRVTGDRGLHAGEQENCDQDAVERERHATLLLPSSG